MTNRKCEDDALDREMMKLLLLDDARKLLRAWFVQGEQRRRLEALKAFVASATDPEMDRILGFYQQGVTTVAPQHVPMEASQARSALQGAGMPVHLTQAAEVKGIPLPALWALVAKLTPILQHDLPALWAAVSEFIAAWNAPTATP